jgi:hypothetical protein
MGYKRYWNRFMFLVARHQLLLLFVTTDAGHQGGQHRVDAVL